MEEKLEEYEVIIAPLLCGDGEKNAGDIIIFSPSQATNLLELKAIKKVDKGVKAK